jgi:uncharacterized membrane protein
MKKLILLTSVMLVSIVICAQNPRAQQGVGKEKKEEAKEKVQDHTKQGQQKADQARKMVNQADEKGQQAAGQIVEKTEQALEQGREAGEVREPQGKAYGRDKGGLSGRDFGQARAAAARNREEKEAVTREVATEVKEGVNRTKTRVEDVREKLVERVRNREISEEEYGRKIQRIKEIEEEVERIEEARKETERVIRENLPEISREIQ